MTMTSRRPQTVQAAIHELAIRCNGAMGYDDQGFNKIDSGFGKNLDLVPPDKWTTKQLWAAHKLLSKYRVQLMEYGIDYTSIPKPEDPSTIKLIANAPGRCAECHGVIHTGDEFAWGTQRGERLHAVCPEKAARPKLRRLIEQVQDGRFAVVVDWYDADRERITDDIRSLDGRLWDKERKAWMIRPTEPNLDWLRTQIEQRGFEITDGDLDQLMSVKQQFVSLRARSEAASSTGEIDGLIDAIFPPSRRPFPYQRAGIEYAYQKKRVLIGDDMGLGKSIQGLGVVLLHNALPCLILCPSSVKFNWRREIKLVKPDARVFVAEGLRCEIPDDVDFVISNYDILAKGVEPIARRQYAPIFTITGQNLADMDLKGIICDEVHACKNGNTNRGAATLALAEGCEVRLGLTGTAIENRPKELVHQLKIVGAFKELFGTEYKFLLRFTNAEHNGFGMDFSGAASPSRLVELNRVLRANCFIRRLKADVLKELPPQTWVTTPVEFTHGSELRRLLIEMKQARRNGEPLVGYFARMREITGRGKTKAVGEMVETLLSGGVEKLVIFSYHRAVQNHLAMVVDTVLRKLGKEQNKNFGSTRIFAEDSARKRDEAAQQFQNDPLTRVINCSWAAREGVTLTAAQYMILAEQDWTPSKMEQIAGRIHRIGQDKNTTVYNCVAEGTIDERIGELLDQKIRIIRAAVDGKLDGDQRQKIDNVTMSQIMDMIDEEIEKGQDV